MIALASAAIAPAGVVRRLTSSPPLALRQVDGDDPHTATLCLVGSAAGPLAGDELTIELEIAEHARARFIATGAMIAQGAGQVPATVLTRVTLAAGARLDADPGPLIVCAGGSVEVRVEIDLDPTAALRWREVLVLGRSHEPAGAARLAWKIDSGGRPLLRQTVDLTDPQRRSWPGMLHGKRVMLSELLVQPGGIHRTIVHSPTAITQRLNENASLRTVLADDAADALQTLGVLAAIEISGTATTAEVPVNA